jgi:hypothetical protein
MTNNSTNNNNTSVYTAVSLDSDSGDLEKPLLEQESTDAPKSSVSLDLSSLNSAFRWHGLIVGFLAQLINVSGTTYMYYQWGNQGLLTNDNDWVDTLWHSLVWVITQIDLYLYVCMWVALTAVLTRSGMNHVRRNYFSVAPSKRSIFVLGVQFYVGVVVGVFLAWTGIDCSLGLPVPLMPMIAVLVFGLSISYTMVWCYDLEDVEDDEEEGEL